MDGVDDDWTLLLGWTVPLNCRLCLFAALLQARCCKHQPLRLQHPLNPAGWRVPSWDPELELTPCMFYEHLIPLRLQAKFSAACMCVCVCVCVPPGTTFSWLAAPPAVCHSILLFPSCYCWCCLPLGDKFSTQACWLLPTSWSSNESLPLFRNVPFSPIMHS